MPLDLTSIAQSALNSVFALGGDVVKDGSYTRPASLAAPTGAVAANEVIVAVKLLIARAAARGLADRLIGAPIPVEERVLIRASELAAINAPAAGDYIIETLTGIRRDVLSAVLDVAGQLWSLHTVRSLHQDYGDLTAHTTSEDWGDLTAASEVEERGAVYE